MSDLVRELRAKAQQSTRTNKRWDDHVAWRGADEIERLSAANAELLEALKAILPRFKEMVDDCGHDPSVGIDATPEYNLIDDAYSLIAKHEGTD